KYGSNFQPFVNKRDVKDGKDEDLTAEPEQIKAFRDTWELGIHSYLTYLRDRLLLARELLTESGSIFVQISDENVHHVRELMDEVFGAGNFVAVITFQTAANQNTKTIPRLFDHLIWYSKEKTKTKYRNLFREKSSMEIEKMFTSRLSDGAIYRPDDIDGFSHIIIIFRFHKSEGYSLKVKTPHDENIKGVFSTRSPRRPNQLGLSVVRFLIREKNILFVEGIDAIDGTPLIDIKPYVPSLEPKTCIKIGWLEGKL
ncbi:TPA: tRNA (N6-threonylcarbamoyladenosine(37)-N6)-methyltransferase TrmO, partial [bacterium]|nr:tRNA (N6-threonylcarbamoyladenosine(37)-N6)-methyltransferase TrmO [bacterium]